MSNDWLQDFVEYGSFGEANPEILWWSGVATVATALRRKVWVDQYYFEWTPNFYIIIVAPPGVVAKTTTIGTGLRLLRQVEGLTLAPSIVSWQRLIEYMGQNSEEVDIPGKGPMNMCCVTLAISELGIFLDPKDRYQTDVLVDLWDGRRDMLDKQTKGNGNDHLENAWVTLVAGTTRAWIAENFTEYSLQGGLMSRMIFLYADKKHRLVALPKKNIPKDMKGLEKSLVDRLTKIANFAGEFVLTPKAEQWMEEWYAKVWSTTKEDSDGRVTRRQAHIVKTAMVISAARLEFPHVTEVHLQEAADALASAEEGSQSVFTLVGQSAITRAAQEIYDRVKVTGPKKESDLYRTYFFRKMSYSEYKEALASAMECNLVDREVIDAEWCITPVEQEVEVVEEEPPPPPEPKAKKPRKRKEKVE